MLAACAWPLEGGLGVPPPDNFEISEITFHAI